MPESPINEQLLAYLPPDRARAVLAGDALPGKAFGAVLFADISGFTPLTEEVFARFGPRRGGEEFTNRLNAVYEALIAEIDHFGGSIIGFAGDAMTVWLAGDDGAGALAIAMALQARMALCGRIVWPDGKEITLSMKVAVSSGTLRRFQAGDPAAHLVDVLAGSVMLRVATCEEVARPGEVVVDERTVEFLGARVEVAGWRDTPPGAKPARVAIARGVRDAPPPARPPSPVFPPDATERLRRWLLPEVARRLVAGQNLFLTELRPAVALFLRFGGIDFDADAEAPAKLDRYIRWIQATVGALEGALLQLTIGEKGNYLYAVWGAPVAHDDDARRALQAALALRRPPPEIAAHLGTVEIGIASGTMRTGAYGSPLRRTYGVLGDETNLAARLMARAGGGEILVSEPTARRQFDHFDLRPLPPMRLKGKAEPVQAYQLLGPRVRGLLSTFRGAYRAVPMIGRRAELAAIEEPLAKARSGAGQVVAIEAEAGMGKTRLLAEIVHRVDRACALFAGDCQVLAREASYAVWIPIWRAFFEVPPEAGAETVRAHLEERLSALDPRLCERAPLLGAVLGIDLPDNSLTGSFDAKVRRSSLEGLLVECVTRRAAREPLLFVLEEAHWMDEASRHLLASLVQAVQRHAVGILLAHRPLGESELLAPTEARLPYVHHVTLGDLPEVDARRLVDARLAAVFEGTGSAPPAALIDLIVARAGGNPFFIEEVANLLRVRRVDFAALSSLETLELPESLHSLILGRIDQMSEEGRTTLKVASVIGRQFQVALLFEVDPLRRTEAVLRPHLSEMTERGVVLPEAGDGAGDEAFLFRHIVIQEVAYETLPFALRSRIHEAIGEALELPGREDWQTRVHLLAFHFERSECAEKKRRYLVAAGEASRQSYALRPAIGYFERALPFLAPAESIDVLLPLGETLELSGRWNEAFQRYVEARKRAETHGTPAQQARCAAEIGDFHRKRGEFAEAALWLERARAENAALGNERGVAHTLHLSATLHAQMGRFDDAEELYLQALAIRERLPEDGDSAKTLNNLGIICRARGDVERALQYYERSLALRRRLLDRREVANSLNNLGYAYRFLRQFDRARAMLEESVTLNRAVGDRWSTANALTSLAELALDTGDVALAESCLKESLSINRELGDLRALAFLLEAFGHLGRLKRKPAAALRCFFGARQLRERIGAPLEPADSDKLQSVLQAVCAELPEGECRAIEARAADLELGQLLDAAAGD
jgi:adenylate cyclase